MSIFSGMFSKMLLSRKPKNNDSKIIVYPRTYINIMLFCSLGFFALYIFLLMLALFFPNKIQDFDNNTIWQMSIIFALIIISTIIFTIYLAKFKIIVNDDNFIYINFFRKTKTYLYKDVYTKLIGRSYQCFSNDKLIVKISLLLDNADLLHKNIKNYQKEHKIVSKSPKTGVIKRTKLWILFSICYFVLSIIFNVLSSFYASWWAWSILCHIPNIIYIIYNIVWKVTFEKDTLTKHSLFAFKKQYKLSELDYTESKNSILYKIYNQKKLIAVVLAIEYNSDLIARNIKYKQKN